MAMKREAILFGGLSILLALMFVQMGTAFSLRMLIESACFAIIALGLTIQWGYAGLFNAGIMGFIAVGAFFSVLISFPVNEKFWNSDAPAGLAMIVLYLRIGQSLVHVASSGNPAVNLRFLLFLGQWGVMVVMATRLLLA